MTNLKIFLVSFLPLVIWSCTETRQVTVDYPDLGDTAGSDAQISVKAHSFPALPGFQAIDGDDYYVRLVSDFSFKGDNVLKKGCESYAPSYKKTDLSAALLFNIRNARLKFNSEAAGFSYQATAGNCNFKFDAKKQSLTPWLRLDHARETQVDYSVLSSANSDVDVAGIVNKVNAAGTVLALTGVGVGVAVLGQAASQWFNINQQNQPKPQATPAANVSTESHTLPPIVSYTDKNGSLKETLFKVYSVAEGGLNLLKSDTQPLGELRITPELTSSLLLKVKPNGLPDARDLSLAEITDTPIRSATGEITLKQLIEQSKLADKPNFKPDWNNYDDVQGNCRKLKLVMKDLGFNKFDRNALVYYFLASSPDWKNYNITAKKAQVDDISLKTLEKYHAKNFGDCLLPEDYATMIILGLVVNAESDWAAMDDSRQKTEQFYLPLKSVERQLMAVLKSANPVEMENRIYPLLNTTKQGDGTVLLQNHLGDFGLERLLQEQTVVPPPLVGPILPNNPTTPTNTAPIAEAVPFTVPNEGLVVNAKQLVRVLSGLALDELSCARAIPGQDGQTANAGIILFTTKTDSPLDKGGAMEFEFSTGKINRIAFQLSVYRDFAQYVLDHPEAGGCRIEPGLVDKLR